MNGPVEVEVRGRMFTIGPMPPVDQFHVMRRYSKVIEAMAEFNAKQSPTIAAEDMTDDELSRFANQTSSAMLNAWGLLSEEDTNYIIAKCLSRVRMQNGPHNTWAPIWSGSGLMFEDQIDYGTLVQLVMRVIQENLTSFSSGPSAESTANSQAA